ncbi:hypothetical protein [Pseudoalteromonas sp. T1lg10]|uniref:hypothetical protein n=1 Tax=Pseudoalteromonas sp. T1lg10 TaxID=2077093 RepID=UPI000CF64400|nr:hypothetical protein [Pseudoalteromonas sp. T1lg10]
MTNKIKQIFKISYDTTATKDHTIDAELLGNAIMKTATVLKHTDKVLNGEESTLDLEVKANSEGSFVIEFVTWFNQSGVNPLSLLGFASSAFGVKTVMDVLGEIKSRPVKTYIDMGKGITKLILNDGTEVEADTKVARLVIDRTFRKELETVIKAPLEGADNAKLIFKDENDTEISEFSEEQVENFKTPARAVVEEVKEEIANTEVRFVKVNFYGETGWSAQLANGDTVAVKMKDEHFLARIDENKQLSKGDLFVVKLKTTTTFKSGSNPAINREIISVERHRAAKDEKLIPDKTND